MPGKPVAPGICPVCGARLEVERLRCPTCRTALEGSFALCSFCALSAEQREFAELFIAARGNLREMERMLGLSYPAIRARLESVIEALGYRLERGEVVGRVEEPGPPPPPSPPPPPRQAPPSLAAAVVALPERRRILEALERGEITVDQALARLRGLPGGAGEESRGG
ncbi:MAG: DUF2089 domain-containing protein [Limnochordaceae bacterium]|nr:DUF2089 domain-containing protein [Limnochordaceae bacterium]